MRKGEPTKGIKNVIGTNVTKTRKCNEDLKESATKSGVKEDAQEGPLKGKETATQPQKEEKENNEKESNVMDTDVTPKHHTCTEGNLQNEVEKEVKENHNDSSISPTKLAKCKEQRKGSVEKCESTNDTKLNSTMKEKNEKDSRNNLREGREQGIDNTENRTAKREN